MRGFSLPLALLPMLRKELVRCRDRALNMCEFRGILPRQLFEDARQVFKRNADELRELVDEACLRDLRRAGQGIEIALPDLVRLCNLLIDRLTYLGMLQRLRQGGIET